MSPRDPYAREAAPIGTLIPRLDVTHLEARPGQAWCYARCPPGTMTDSYTRCSESPAPCPECIRRFHAWFPGPNGGPR